MACLHRFHRQCTLTRHLLSRPIGDGLVFLGRLPFLDEGQELRLARYVFAQDFGDVEAFGGLVVFEDAAEGSLGGADWW
jgi:hypothetical protein